MIIPNEYLCGIFRENTPLVKMTVSYIKQAWGKTSKSFSGVEGELNAVSRPVEQILGFFQQV